MAPGRLRFKRSAANGSSPLTAAQISYVGALRMPLAGLPGNDGSYAGGYGGIGGRIIGGRTHLFIYDGGAISSTPPSIYELDITGLIPDRTYTAAPRATIVQNWGNTTVYGSARTTWTAAGDPKSASGFIPVALHFNPDTALLYWTFIDAYNVADSHAWSLGASVLNGDGTSSAAGPWRFSATDADGVSVTGQRSYLLAEHPDSLQLLTAGTASSGDAGLSWGPSLFGTVPWPQMTTPSGNTGGPHNTTNDIALPDRYLNYHYMADTARSYYFNADGSIHGSIRSFQFSPPLTYAFERLHGTSAAALRVDPTLNGGKGTWSGSTSAVNGLFWVKGPTRQAVVFGGPLSAAYSADPTDPAGNHEWYFQQGQLAVQVTGVSGLFQINEAVTGLSSGNVATIAGAMPEYTAGWLPCAQVDSGGSFPLGFDFTVGETIRGSTSLATGTVAVCKRQDTCAHGFRCVQCASAGDSQRNSIAALLLFDPARLMTNAAGTTTDYTTEASEIIDLERTYGIRVASQASLQAKAVSGLWYPRGGTRFYLSCNQADDSRGLFETLIHVFDMAL
jgi:hypothetical protein